ncbi:hypothetical protein FQZ97_1057430 [compost metagenome]
MRSGLNPPDAASAASSAVGVLMILQPDRAIAQISASAAAAFNFGIENYSVTGQWRATAVPVVARLEDR